MRVTYDTRKSRLWFHSLALILGRIMLHVFNFFCIWRRESVNVFYVGHGSTLDFSQEMIAGMHAIISDMKKHFKLKNIRVLDVPCGDMQYMSRFLETRDDINYTGVDIVPQLIMHHREKYAHRPWTFRALDIAADSTFVNEFDLIISRSMMQHLDNAAVFSILKKLSAETRHPSFLLATTFSTHSNNNDLDVHRRYRFRRLNLELPPFRLEPPLCIFRDGYVLFENFMGLWRLPLMTIPESLCSSRKPAKFFTKLSADEFCTCISWQ